MLLLPHVLVGVAIASSIQNPALAVPLSFGMHFLGDMVPHWDFYSNTQKEERLRGWRPLAVMFDFGLGIAVGMAFISRALWVTNDARLALNIFLCGIASVLPDILEGPHIFMEKEPWITKFVYSIQHRIQFQAPLPWGLVTQFVVVLAALLLIASSIR